MKTEEMSLDSLIPYERNAKVHDETQVANVAKSIEEFGMVQPIVIDGDNNIIIGHCRALACKRLGLKKVPVVKMDDITPEEANRLRFLDNKLNESAWDMEMIKLDGLSEVDFEGFDLDFDFSGLSSSDDYEVQEDDVPPVPEEPTAKEGEIYQLGEHRLICGDSTDPDVIKNLMGGAQADMVFTDPPYGMKKEKDGVLNDNLNYDDLLDFNRKWVPLTFDALKGNGSWYCWGIDEPLMDIYSEILRPMKKRKGQDKLTFRNLITWDKGNGQGQLDSTKRMYAVADEKCLFVMMGRQTYGETEEDYWDGFEPIRTSLIAIRDSLKMNTDEVIKYAGATTCSHWFAKSQWEFPAVDRYNTFCENCLSSGRISREEYDRIREEYDRIREEWYKTRAYFDNTHDNMNNVWHFDRTSQEERKQTGGHATPKPIALCSRAIKSSSREGEIVLDVFGGSGSTLIACEQTNRKCYMCELDPHYVDVIIERWQNLTGEKAVKL